jgi:hypothetical protein
MVAQKGATHQNKRHGKHQKRTRHFTKVYWPYLPMAVILSIGLVFSVLWQPRVNKDVLAYATSMSTGALLQATNNHRAANGKATLGLNSLLNNAAQAKANDMATRNYWSHNTPEGNPPWIFITNAGYQYKTAGENLAYGFATSEDTVTGWMNSPGHRANMLNSSFTEVGFGYVNSASYNGVSATGSPQTIVVAMYAAPLVSSPAPAPAATAPAATTTTTPQTKPANEAPAPAAKEEEKSPPIAIATQKPSTEKSEPITEPPTKSITRVAAMTNGSMPWLTSLASMLLIFGLASLGVRHSIAIHRWIRRGERYILHHAVFDVTIISLIGLCFIATQSSGLYIL